MNETKQHQHIRAMVEGAIMIALATILGYFRIFRLPEGGSVDLSLIPILVYCLRWGPKWSFGCCLVNGILQFILGGGIAIGWQSMLLDYVVAYTLVFLTGFGSGKKLGWIWGTVLGTAGRFVSLLLSGAIIWGEYMPETFMSLTMTNPWFYSFLYNGVLSLAVLAVDLAVLAIMQAVPYLRTKVLSRQF